MKKTAEHFVYLKNHKQMYNSFLDHAWGLYTHECTRKEYKGNAIILHIQAKAKEREKVCPRCGKHYLVSNYITVGTKTNKDLLY